MADPAEIPVRRPDGVAVSTAGLLLVKVPPLGVPSAMAEYPIQGAGVYITTIGFTVTRKLVIQPDGMV
jgi:hypothetical protein